MTDLNLRDLQTLTDLQSALARFADGAQEALRVAEAEIRRTQEWLQERVGHWQRQVEEARRSVARAEADLRRCEASGYYDRDGRYYPPDCRAEMGALARAQAHLRECEDNLRTAQAWRSRVEQAVNEYQREARRLSDVASGHTERARSRLGILRGKYELVQTAAAALMVGAGLVFLRQIIGRANVEAGALAEEVAQKAVEDELGLKVVNFDQAKHGFDRVFHSPSGHLIVLESKLNSDGHLALGKTSDGHRQASAGWVARVAQAMTDSNSTQWSADNEQIGRRILETGAENVPVIATVLNPNTELVDIYLRLDTEAEDWTLLASKVSLKDLENE